MTTEIVALPPPTVTPMTLLQTAISNQVDPDKLGKLIELSEQWNRDRAAENFALAITNFQRDCPMIGKDRSANDKDGRPMYYFAAFEDIWRKVRHLLSDNAIAVTFDTQPAEGLLSVTCKIRVGIHVETTNVCLPIPPATARCNATQALASAVSYGKRYAFCSALGIVTADEDDDAQSVTPPVEVQAPRQAAPQATPAPQAVRKINAQERQALTILIEQCEAQGLVKELDPFWGWLKEAGIDGPDQLGNMTTAIYDLAMKGLRKKLTEKKGKVAR
jgi:hypothetical protein